MFCKESVLKNFAKVTEKKPVPESLFNEVAGKKRLCYRYWHRCFPVNFGKFLRTPFLIKHVWWLLLTSC